MRRRDAQGVAATVYRLRIVERLLVALVKPPPVCCQGFHAHLPNTTGPHAVEEQGSQCASMCWYARDLYLVLLTSEDMSLRLLRLAGDRLDASKHLQLISSYCTMYVQTTARWYTECSQDRVPYRSNVSGCSGAGPCSYSGQGGIVVGKGNGNRRQNRLATHGGPGLRA